MGSAFSVATLADHWGCSLDTVYAMVRSGQLRHFKVGGKLIRIRADEVERFECQQNTASNDTEAFSPSCGSRGPDVTDIRLERLIERPQRPQLVRSGPSAR